jgi:hypothetical protein
MPDCSWAKITIGGPIPHNLVKELRTKILTHISVDPEQVLIQDGAPIEFEDHSAIGGIFENLEDYLVDNVIAFDREGAGHYNYDGEVRKFRPGVCDHRVLVTTDGSRVLNEYDLTPIWLYCATLEEVRSEITKALGLDIDNLQDITIETTVE